MVVTLLDFLIVIFSFSLIGYLLIFSAEIWDYVLYKTKKIGNHFKAQKEKTVTMLWSTFINKFYRKYNITPETHMVDYTLWKQIFPNGSVRKFKTQILNHMKTLTIQPKHREKQEQINNTVKWYYETCIISLEDANKKHFIINNKTMHHGQRILTQTKSRLEITQGRNSCCDTHNMGLLTMSEIYTLTINNISPEKYFHMKSKGHRYNNILNWGEIPYEWVEKLELVN